MGRERGRTLADGRDAVGVFIGDLDGELLCGLHAESVRCPGRAAEQERERGGRTLDGHDHLDGVERVEAEVVGERRGRGDLC